VAIAWNGTFEAKSSNDAFEANVSNDGKSASQAYSGSEVIVSDAHGIVPHMNDAALSLKLGGRNPPRRRERTRRHRPKQQLHPSVKGAQPKGGSPTLKRSETEGCVKPKPKPSYASDNRLEEALGRVDNWKKHARSNSNEPVAVPRGTAQLPGKREKGDSGHPSNGIKSKKTKDLQEIMEQASQISDKWRKYDRTLSTIDLSAVATVENSRNIADNSSTIGVHLSDFAQGLDTSSNGSMAAEGDAQSDISVASTLPEEQHLVNIEDADTEEDDDTELLHVEEQKGAFHQHGEIFLPSLEDTETISRPVAAALVLPPRPSPLSPSYHFRWC
jgi:hypothetical protein